ncbi:aldo/keto reductase [Dysgonomonas sp. 216]|uniref:aldo/keto reductase n=1 Tax=Dysgonomonas sp. 216 TaxID=2302934 RepID=UPI0013D7891D|nr:aldo/keto reductase [Dysgonomonas sp. 216]NDW18897.1 aldo/keto reductase [Dysgonomonas sp. 216]
MKKAKLNNGTLMPYIGLGVFRMEDNDESQKAIETALSVGYRHIDTAAVYGNEDIVGKAIKNSGIARKDIFITTKVWNEDMRSGKVKEAFESSLKKLETDYVDLYLIHWPVKEKFVDTWLEMEKIYKKGKAKAIGVSNFKEHHLDELIKSASIIPAVNQIELHPYLIQQSVLDYCKRAGIHVEAWSPFAAQKTNLFSEKILLDLADKYNKTPAQIILRWNYQRDVIVIPKSSNEDRLKQNLDFFDFKLSDNEIIMINSLNKDKRVGSDPDTFTF